MDIEGCLIMPQYKLRLDLTAAAFPMLMRWAGRTVLQANAPEGNPQLQQPQMLYCHNVLPTQAGLKSVSYHDIVASHATNTKFSRIFTVSDINLNKALVAVTTDSKIFILTSTGLTWLDITPVGWAGGDAVTCASANGVYYLYLSKFGLYSVGITVPGLTHTAPAGITEANILGVFSSVNYLCLYDTTTIYRSSTVNPLDFVPSLITGAGSEVPNDLAGHIVVVVQLNQGFVVYTSVNIILASYSNNTQFPWIYRSANNGAGIQDASKVSYTQDSGFHIALTYAGVLQVSPQGCQQMVPEVSDFLAARVYEYYDPASDTFSETALSANLLTHIAIVSARYVVLSYGITSLTDAIVFDMVSKRWGKLHTTHVMCFEVEVGIATTAGAYTAAAELGQPYTGVAGVPYNEVVNNINTAPDMGRVFGFLRNDGSISLATLDYDSVTDNAVVLLGKYQAVRNAMLTLDRVEVETIPVDNTGFSIVVLPSIDGKNLLQAVAPYVEPRTLGDLYVGLCRIVGKNHVVVVKGSFNLTTVEITADIGGHR